MDGVSPADLVPYGEAELSTALTAPPERLQRAAAETNPFDERFLVPADAARRVKEAVTRLVNLPDEDESGAEGRILEVIYGRRGRAMSEVCRLCAADDVLAWQ